jgi:hypothetical protein
VFRRQALDRGAKIIGATKIATGHNADDIAETVLMNLLRGDIARLGRCVQAVTGAESDMPRCKPFKYSYEKEIVMYAYHKNLEYFSTECIYSPNAYRGFAREYIKDLEIIRPSVIMDIIYSAEFWAVDDSKGPKPAQSGGCASNGGRSGRCRTTGEGDTISDGTTAAASTSSCCGGGCGTREIATDGGKVDGSSSSTKESSTQVPIASTNPGTGTHAGSRKQSTCVRCGYMTSSTDRLCKACVLLQTLESGKPLTDLAVSESKQHSTSRYDAAQISRNLLVFNVGDDGVSFRLSSVGGASMSDEMQNSTLDGNLTMNDSPTASAARIDNAATRATRPTNLEW